MREQINGGVMQRINEQRFESCEYHKSHTHKN